MLIEFELLRDLNVLKGKCRELVKENKELKEELEIAGKVAIQQDLQVKELQNENKSLKSKINELKEEVRTLKWDINCSEGDLERMEGYF